MGEQKMLVTDVAGETTPLTPCYIKLASVLKGKPLLDESGGACSDEGPGYTVKLCLWDRTPVKSINYSEITVSGGPNNTHIKHRRFCESSIRCDYLLHPALRYTT